MSSSKIDSYHRLLGIPLADQPPTPWRLLGLEEGEENETVIRTAMDQRLVFLRSLQHGALADASQRLANEVTRAALFLTHGTPLDSVSASTSSVTGSSVAAALTAIAPEIASPPPSQPHPIPSPGDLQPESEARQSPAPSNFDNDLAWQDDGEDFRLAPHELAPEGAEAEDLEPVPAWVDDVLRLLPESLRMRLEPHAALAGPMIAGGAIGLVAMVPLLFGVVLVSRWINGDSQEIAQAPDPRESLGPAATNSNPETPSNPASPDPNVPTIPPGNSQSPSSTQTDSPSMNSTDGSTSPSTPTDPSTPIPPNTDLASDATDATPLFEPPPAPLLTSADPDPDVDSPDIDSPEPMPEPAIAKTPIDWLDLVRERTEQGLTPGAVLDPVLRVSELIRIREKLQEADLPLAQQAALQLESWRGSILARDLEGIGLGRDALAKLPVIWPSEFDLLQFEVEVLEQSFGTATTAAELGKSFWLVNSVVRRLWQAQRFTEAARLARNWEDQEKFNVARDYRRLALDLGRNSESLAELLPTNSSATASTDSDPSPNDPSPDDPSSTTFSEETLSAARWQVVALGDYRSALRDLGVTEQAAWTELFDEPWTPEATPADTSTSPASSTSDPMSTDSEPASPPEPFESPDPREMSLFNQPLQDTQQPDDSLASEPPSNADPLQDAQQARRIHATAQTLWNLSTKVDRKHRSWMQAAAGALHDSADLLVIPIKHRDSIIARIHEAEKQKSWCIHAGQLAPLGAAGAYSVRLAEPHPPTPFPFDPASSAIASSNDLLALGSPQGPLTILSPRTGETLYELEGHQRTITALSFFPDESKLISAGLDASIRVWDLQRKTEVSRWPIVFGEASQLVVAPQGRFINVGTANGVLYTLNPNSGELTGRINAHQNGVRLIIGSPDAKRWVTAGNDDRAFLWGEPADEPLQLVESTNKVNCAAFAADMSSVALGDDRGNVMVFETTSGQPLTSFKFPSLCEVIAVNYFGDHGIVLAVSNTGFVVSHHLADGKTDVGRLTERRGRTALSAPVKTARFSSDGRELIAIANDERGFQLNVRHWNLFPVIDGKSFDGVGQD